MKKNILKNLLLLTWCSLFYIPSPSQQIKQFLLKPATSKDLKLISNVRDIDQDPFGFLWIATQDGLYRYDSRNIETYNTHLEKKHLIESSDVRTLLVDSAMNIIWFVSSGGNFHGVDLTSGTVRTKQNVSAIMNKGIIFFTKLCDYRDSVIMASNNGVFVFNKKNQKFSVIVEIEELRLDIDYAFILDHTLIILSKNKGIFQYDIDRKKIISHITTEQVHLNNDVRFFDVVHSGDKSYIASSYGIIGLQLVNDSMLIERNILDFIPIEINNHISSLKFDRSGHLWFSNDNNVVQVDLVLKKFSIIQNTVSKDDNWLNSVYKIFCDKNDNIWLGCQQGLAMIRNKEPAFVAFNSGNTISPMVTHAYYIYPANDSILYVCAENGLFYINSKQNSIEIIDKIRVHDYIFKDPSGRIMVSNIDGFFELKNKRFIPAEHIYPEFKKLGTVRINSSIEINDSCLAFGTENYQGIIIWDHIHHNVSSFTTTTSALHLNENVTNTIKFLSKNKFAVLGDSYFGIFDFKNKNYQPIQLKNSNTPKKYSLFFDLCRIKDKFYLACYGTGVIILTESFQQVGEISTKNGLSNNGTYKLLPWKDSLLFITTNNGLNCFNINTKKITQFFESDGLHNNLFEETSGNSYGSTLYAGGKNGFTIIKPEYILPSSRIPMLYFSKIITELSNNRRTDTSDIAVKKYYIDKNALQTTIYFSAIDYDNPERISFAYRIREQSNAWINLKDQGFVPFIGFSPGTYHLQVQAFNEDGVPSEIKELTLVFLPKWYQTWWLKLLVLLSIATAIYGLYRFRINHLKREEKIRNQVAGDLHDELGSTLNSVKVFTNLAMMEKENTGHLEKIKEATQSAISGVKDIIWVLDDKRDTLDHLLNRINQFARPICQAAGISYNQQSGGNENYKLGKEEKRNLYMIIKESINNSIKYAECSVIELLIKNNGGKLIISVSDDGKGFDKAETTSGYGLRNIKRRSEEIGYLAEINSSPGNGTLVYLEKK